MPRKFAVFAVLVSGAAMAQGCAGGHLAGSQEPEVSDIRIAGTDVFPESIAADANGNIYAGSADGMIYRAPAGSQVTEPWILPDERNGLAMVFGVLASDRQGLLLVCANPSLAAAQPGATAALKMFSLADGSYTANFAFPPGPAICNDIALSPGGDIFVTETLGGRIFVLRRNANELALFAEAADLVGVDGIAFAEDGTMYVNNVRRNLIQRVERDSDGQFAGLAALDLSRPIAGPDGLRLLGGNRFLQAESAADLAAVVTIDGDRAVIETVREGIDTPAAVTSIGAIGYAAEGKIRYRTSPEMRGQDPGTFIIRSFPIPGPD